MHLLCRNRVANYDTWWAVFSAHAEAQREAGLHLVQLWRSEENANDVWFLFEVADVDRARAFMDAPGAAEAARDTNVLEGEWHFVNEVDSDEN